MYTPRVGPFPPVTNPSRILESGATYKVSETPVNAHGITGVTEIVINDDDSFDYDGLTYTHDVVTGTYKTTTGEFLHFHPTSWVLTGTVISVTLSYWKHYGWSAGTTYKISETPPAWSPRFPVIVAQTGLSLGEDITPDVARLLAQYTAVPNISAGVSYGFYELA